MKVKDPMKLQPKELEKIQLYKLKKTLKRAKNSKFYHKRIDVYNISTLDDIKKFDFTTKQDLRDNAPFGFLAVPLREVSRYHESFGTTGIPTPSWFTQQDFEACVEQISRCAVNFNDKDIVLIRFPYAISVPAHKFHAAAERRGACVIPVSSRTPISPHSRVIHLMRKLNVSILCSISLEAILLAETSELMGYNPHEDFESLRAICVTGDLCPKSRMERISKLWDVDVHATYGATEVGNMAVTCTNKELHCLSDHFLFEVVDPVTGEWVDEGEVGELVVTTLYRRAMPLIRYKTGDMVKLKSYENCSCNWTHPIIEILGRKQERILFTDKEILLGELMNEIAKLPEDVVDNLWMGIIQNDKILIKAESKKPGISTEHFSKALSEKFNLPIELVLVEKGTLLNRKKLLKVDPIIKSRYITDWRSDINKPRTLDEILIGYHTFIKGDAND